MSNYQSYMAASDRVVDLIVRSVAEDGEFIGDGFTGDLVAIYKAPSLLLLGGRPDVASRLLNYIKRRYGQEDGDFLSNPEKSGNERRTYNPVVREYAAYMGGWVLLAAQRLGRFEISLPAFDCVQSYWSPTARSFIPDQPYNKSREQEVETVITSHLGLISLYLHDLEKARGAADALVHIAHQQTELDTRFVLRMWESTGKLITEKKSADSLDQMYFVYRDRKDEFFFMLGYPAIFLAKFYLATTEAKYLESARKYLDFLLTCDQSLYSFYLSHKVAYGAAIVGRITKEPKYITLATKIADYLVSEQDKDGVFCAQSMSGKDEQYDQAAEIGIWLREMNKYQRYMDASNRAVDFLVRNITDEGEFIAEGHAGDLGGMSKAPLLLLLGGRLDLSVRLLEYISRRFGQKNGDFISYPGKSGKERRANNDVIREFEPYLNGWITLAAQRVGRFDLSTPAYEYLQSYWSPKARSFIVNEPYNPASDWQIVDTMISSHLGLISLFFRDMDRARGAADAVVRIFELQTELDTRFVFRMWASTGRLITDRVTTSAADQICFLQRDGKDEYYFMLGFPIIFLAKFYEATNESKYLEFAKKYLDFATSCDETLYTFYLGHKVGYGAAIVARLTKEQKYLNTAVRIADNLVSLQDREGIFAAARMPLKHDQYDQVAEIGIWLREIYTELNGVGTLFPRM